MMNKIDSKKVNESEIEESFNLGTTLSSEGFDLQAGETWIYPTNYSLREYQYNIIQKALLNNTMVSLPTGLGKTFIAAVVMYNFYRWYPLGKIIFMAPTKPLVAQQIDACYNIMAIPKDVTAELTGAKNQIHRKEVWNEKRVFFITPQVLQNDLSILNEFATKIKCLVFDEAHKAKGNHAYCEVIRKILPHNKNFRVVGLSATPGNTLTDVLEVINNLLISHIEIRTEESQDVLPYVYQRTLETCVVPLGEKLEEVKLAYIKIIDNYTRVLVKHRIIAGNCSTFTKGKIFMTMKNFKENAANNRTAAYSEIMRNLNICVTLYHAFELLVRHGLRGFLSFFQEHSDKPLLRGNMSLKNLMREVDEYLGPAPNVVPLPDGSIEEIPECIKFGHPKFYKLRDILCEHFSTTKETESRVIVFCEYRESVTEAYGLLLRHKPLIKPRIFLGQGAITQRQQINVIKSFRSGECNTLISTCIGEEGLDVGDVDLIICFDISNKSPVRMIQRMGRTGRKRQGRIVVLVTEGKEQQTLQECLIHKHNLSSHILQSNTLQNQLYTENPRMVPDHIIPRSQKLFITVQQNKTKKTSNIKDLFDNINKKESNLVDNDVEIIESEDKLPGRREYWNKVNPLSIENEANCLNFSKNISKLRVPQPTGKIGHSKSTNLLMSVLQFADSKKYNISTTQVPVLSSQMNQPTRNQQSTSNVLRQTDIRNMFFKFSSSSQLSQISEGESAVKIQNVIEKCTDILSSINLQSQIVDCKICNNLFSCSQYSNINDNFDIRTCIEVDQSIMDCLNEVNLNCFLQSLNIVEAKLTQSCDLQSKPESTTLQNEDPNNSVFFRKDSFIDKTITVEESPFKPPSNIHNLQNFGLTSSFINSAFNDTSFTQTVTNVALNVSTPKVSSKDQDLPPLNYEDFEKAEFTQVNKTIAQNFQETLSFFNMTTLEELFEESSPKSTSKIGNVLDETIIYSPPKNHKITESLNGSPIISGRSQYSRNHVQVSRRLFNESKPTAISNDSSTDIFIGTSFVKDNNSKQTNNLCQKEDLSEEDLFDESDMETPCLSTANQRENQQSKIEVEDLIDLSIFGLGGQKEKTQSNIKSPVQSGKTIINKINDNFCDNSFLDLFFGNNKEEQINKVGKDNLPNKNDDVEVITLDDTPEGESLTPTNKTKSNLSPKKSSEECLKDKLEELEKSPTLSKSQYYYQDARLQHRRKTLCEDEPRSTKLSLKNRISNKINNNIGNTSMGWYKITSSNKNVNEEVEETSPILSSQNRTFRQTVASDTVKRLDSDNSDDDFELPSKKNYSWIKKRPNPVKEMVKSPTVRKKGGLMSNKYVTRKAEKRKPNDCEYFDLEAEVSFDTNATLDSSKSEENDDTFEASFVDDETQNIANTTVMHAHYLQSVKSPIMNRGKFKIPDRQPFAGNVYSQVVQHTENYLNDTFCVASGDENSPDKEDLSELELAELILEQEKKKRKKAQSSNERPNKKRRMVVLSSSDSE